MSADFFKTYKLFLYLNSQGRPLAMNVLFFFRIKKSYQLKTKGLNSFLPAFYVGRSAKYVSELLGFNNLFKKKELHKKW